jgi:hypothetical protein
LESDSIGNIDGSDDSNDDNNDGSDNYNVDQFSDDSFD